MKQLWDLFRTFFRIGIFTFGGGYAMFPLMEREIVEHRGWATQEDMVDYFAIGQCTPGITTVNIATIVGYTRKKTWGSLAATLGLITPSIAIIVIIASVLSNFAEIPAVAHAFAGIRIAVCALITATVIKLFKSTVTRKTWVLCVVPFALVAVFGISPVYMVAGAIVAGLLFFRKAEA